VAAIAQMGGDSVGAGGDGEMGGAHRIGQGAAARIPHRGDMIDVDAQTQPLGHDSGPPLRYAVLRSPRVRTGAVTVIYPFVIASDLSEKWNPLFGPML